MNAPSFGSTRHNRPEPTGNPAASDQAGFHPRLPVLLMLLALLSHPVVRAGLPEPDHVLYGTITLDGQPITAAQTDVRVEARRLIGSPPIASYRMGANDRLGNFYSLRLSLESSPPLTSPNASLAGEALFIVVVDGTGIRAQTGYSIGDPGAVQRLDFGATVPDGDGDGLPDAWELTHLGSTAAGPNTVNANGQTALQNYVAGTNPNDTNSVFAVDLSLSDLQTTVSFRALHAEGAGYSGLTRYYSLETATDLGAITWIGVPGYTNLVGNNQTVLYQTLATNPPTFYRGRVWLQSP
jgi:hypothetical protein